MRRTMSAALQTDFSGWKLFATAMLVALNGIFVAAEFALVKVRVARIDALANKGSKKAGMVRHILSDLNLYLSACQLGITLASLALGWLAEPAIATLLVSAAASAGIDIAGPAVHIVALILALSIVTILHITIGEQAPKVFAIQKPEPMAMFIAYPLHVFAVTFRPFIWFINVISNWLLRLVGITDVNEHDQGHDVDELRAVLRSATRSGHISKGQRAFGENILGLMRLEVRHIMLPRVDVVYLSTEKTTEENLEIVKKSDHTRFPLCGETLEDVHGVVHGKDILTALLSKQEVDLVELSRPLATIPDTQLLSRLILEQQKAQQQCAIVVDEHGTTVGMAFLEDALEEIVGPLHDEFDKKVPWVTTSKEGTIEMAGSIPLPEAEHLLGLELSNDTDTVGGFVTDTLGRLPETGETLEFSPYLITVLSMSKRRVARVRFEIQERTAEKEAE
jgi:CBS domain containing-hemolysin-like protein